MKKVTLITVLSLICSVSISLMAQNQNVKKMDVQPVKTMEGPHKIRFQPDVLNLKMNYFKSNFKVSDEKAEKFWAIFGEHLKGERKIHERIKKSLEEKGIKKEKGKIDFTKLSDEQIYFYYENQFKQKERLAENEQKFYQQIKELLSAQEISEYYRLEKRFRTEISQEARMKKI